MHYCCQNAISFYWFQPDFPRSLFKQVSSLIIGYFNGKYITFGVCPQLALPAKTGTSESDEICFFNYITQLW